MNHPAERDNETTRASLELLYHISRELAATLDLPILLQRVLFLSMRNIGASSGSIIVLDDSGRPVESAIIHRTHVIEQTTQQLRVTIDKGLAGWVIRQRQAVMIPDTSKDERWLRRPDDAQDATGPKSAVSAPFLARDRLVGVMTLVHPQTNFFTLEHLALVQAIADQAAIAVLNARLYAESQRQVRVMSALAESAAAINASLNPDEVLRRILEQTSQALRVEAASLALIDPARQELEYKASTSKWEKNVTGVRLKMGQGVAGWVARQGRGLIVPDAYQDARFYPEIDRMTGFKTRAIACAPIRSQGEVIGIIEAINPQEGAFSADALVVLNGISSLAESAIQHAQLFKQIEAAHKRYRDLFEDNINSLLISDWRGHIQEANRQTTVLTRYDKETLQRMTVTNLHKIDETALGVEFANLRDGQAITYESILCNKDGGETPIEVRVHPVNIMGASYLQWVFRDISERKELDQLREDLISSIYHDLRSPLSNVISSLDVLENVLPQTDPTIQSLMNIAMRSTERIQRLTSSLLDVNRLEAGQPIASLQPADPYTLVLEAIDVIAPIASNKKQQIANELPGDLLPIMVDADMIRRVLINLLENAIKYTPPGGNIRVGGKSVESWVRLWVEDSGQGIPPAKREAIFDKFARLQDQNGPGGIGLGLAYCRLAVEGHGGRIWVEDALDGGSHFTFILPIASESETGPFTQNL